MALRAVVCVLIVSLLPVTIFADCKIPELWDGTWFIKELDRGFDIIVNSSTSSISRRNSDELGNCVWRKNDFYVFRNTNESCSKCVFISQKHKNILFSREGYCKLDNEWDADNLEETLCNELIHEPHDQSHYYWFRNDYKPINCPLSGASFEFSYRRVSTTTTTCRNPVSRASSCMDHSKMQFQYQACPDNPNSAAKVEQLTCVGDWEESSLRYHVADVGRPNSPANSLSSRERFRCFTIQTISIKNPDSSSRPDIVLEYKIGTADSATCTGLQNPEDAETMLNLKKETYADPNWRPSTFPRWLAAHKWMDMGATVELFLPLQLKNKTIHVVPLTRENPHDYYHTGHHGPGFFPLSHGNLKCLAISNVTEGSDAHIVVLAEYSVGCRIDPVCLHLIRRSDYIFQLYYLPRGEMNKTFYHENCLNATFSSFEKEATMVSMSGIEKACPVQGSFSVNAASPQNSQVDITPADSRMSQIFSSAGQWSIGCKSDENLSVEMESSVNLDDLYCLDEWTEGQHQYTAVSTGKEPGPILCMANKILQESEVKASELPGPTNVILTSRDCIGLQDDEILNPKINAEDDWDDRGKSVEVGSEGNLQLELISTGPCDSRSNADVSSSALRELGNKGTKPVEPSQHNSALKGGGNVCGIILIALVIPWFW